MENTKKVKYPQPEHLIILGGFFVLFLLSLRFARERVIFTDTAVYLFTIADSGHFYIATNRFITVLSQVLPMAGIVAGFSLKTIVYLYSINCILIPIGSAFICIKLFRDRQTALAILLFYIIMSTWVFYYPVTEFQIGLCLLLVYHSFLLWYFKREDKRQSLFAILSILMVITIVFSHPLSLYVFFAWMVWILVNHAESRKRIMILPIVIALLTHVCKEYFFKTFVGGAVIYDEQRKEGLRNFKAPISTWFDSVLAKESIHAISGDYFLIPILILLVIIFFIWSRKWLPLLLFIGITIGFWLLVTVSFRDWPYNHYPEHLYQPIPFFVSLVFASAFSLICPAPRIRAILLMVIVFVSFSKIYSNHEFFSNRLAWYQRFINLVHSRQIHKATLSASYYVDKHPYAYWASQSEFALLSALSAPDSAVQIIVDADAVKLNKEENGKQSTTPYFKGITGRYISLDSLYAKTVLDSLANRR